MKSSTKSLIIDVVPYLALAGFAGFAVYGVVCTINKLQAKLDFGLDFTDNLSPEYNSSKWY